MAPVGSYRKVQQPRFSIPTSLPAAWPDLAENAWQPTPPRVQGPVGGPRRGWKSMLTPASPPVQAGGPGKTRSLVCSLQPSSHSQSPEKPLLLTPASCCCPGRGCVRVREVGKPGHGVRKDGTPLSPNSWGPGPSAGPGPKPCRLACIKPHCSFQQHPGLRVGGERGPVQHCLSCSNPAAVLAAQNFPGGWPPVCSTGPREPLPPSLDARSWGRGARMLNPPLLLTQKASDFPKATQSVSGSRTMTSWGSASLTQGQRSFP